MKELITDEAPDSIGPFSQGIITGDRIYVSGQGPINPDTGEIMSGTPSEQTRRTLQNIEAILQAGDASLNDIVKSTVYVRDMRYYDDVNEVYAEVLSSPYPARSAVEVVKLPVDIDVEIEVVAER